MHKERNELIAKLKTSEEYIYELYFYDSLTKLPNRKRLVHQYKLSEAEKKSIFIVDIDRFHSINELYGRDIGDQLLQYLAERLSSLWEEENMVYRDGDDQFFIFLENLKFEHLSHIGSQILETISSPIELDGRIFYITASIGISHYPETGGDIKELLHQAEMALFKIKHEGKNNSLVYVPEDAQITERKNRIEFDLNQAIRNEEFFLVYQPKVHLETGEITAVEALMRWNHPELGNISPGEFIPVAEKSGLIIDLGYWVIYEATRQMKEWQDMGIDLRIAVNVSVIQFKDQLLVDRFVDTISLFKMDPSNFIIEITESVMSEPEHAKRVVKQLHNYGFKVAIDDFGTGYSSLSLLNNMAVDILKIDRSFIQDIPAQKKSVSLVKTMIQMGGNLGYHVVAEGIETIEQQEFLIQNECGFGQGFYFSHPIRAQELAKHIQRRKEKLE